MSSKVWFITGTSVGLGFELVNAVLARGDRVIATARDISNLKDIYPDSDNLRFLKLDVTAGIEAIREVADKAEAFWGHVDVVVNNAGYAEIGLIEESGSAAFKKQYDTNVFGLIDVTTAFLPYMRERKSGIFVQMGSRSAWSSELHGIAMYASSKAAVRAFSETLATEVASFGIKVLIMEPGGFQSRGTSNFNVNEASKIPEYAEAHAIMDRISKALSQMFKGDPRKLGEFVVDVVKGEGKAAKELMLPRYLVCGPGANEGVLAKCETMKAAVEYWQWVTPELLVDT
ncbi:hypothetical protein BDV98DRAFT_614345 [Pterulicium gracile]|uniref:NAD(P)-binding protein n=1 Tax=Pterulicium gracile TaxID=1884261 RepID=A0A5C3QDN2_9AGAR|nr:hypothetical protein BDV98DRAFT_614345 [Pterula gracilis]